MILSLLLLHTVVICPNDNKDNDEEEKLSKVKENDDDIVKYMDPSAINKMDNFDKEATQDESFFLLIKGFISSLDSNLNHLSEEQFYGQVQNKGQCSKKELQNLYLFSSSSDVIGSNIADINSGNNI